VEKELKRFTSTRYQDYLNDKIPQCEIFILMCFSKMGKFTQEEFDLAFSEFNKENNPRHLFVYFKIGDVSMKAVNSETVKVNEFKDFLEKKEQIYTEFKKKEELLEEVSEQIELLIPEIMGNS
jgi:hypothetical protein